MLAIFSLKTLLYIFLVTEVANITALKLSFQSVDKLFITQVNKKKLFKRCL